MKVLHLTRGDKPHSLNRRFIHVPEGIEVEHYYLMAEDQKDLSQVFSRIELAQFDRIVIDIKWGYLKGQERTLRKAMAVNSRLVIYEHDAWFNYAPFVKECGKFSSFYRRLPGVLVIVPSRYVADQLQQEGINAHCVVKSYDDQQLYPERADRSVELGFIGTTSNKIYRKRNEFLRVMEKRCGLHIFQAHGESEYRAGLNRIQIFVSADIGMNEYMAKNFEAMGCGCLLMAYRQGIEEAEIGLVDMQNCVLYGDESEFCEKLALLRFDKGAIERIARAGYDLVRARHTHQVRDLNMFSIVTGLPPKYGNAQTLTWTNRIKRYFFK